MEKSIDIAAKAFVSLHKARFIDVDHMHQGYGSIAGFLSAEGQPHGDLGLNSIEIKAHEHKDGCVDTVEWFEDTFQIGCYRLPFADRVTPEDHTPTLSFDPDFNWCMDHIEELIEEGYCDFSLDEVVEGVIVDSIDLEEYLKR